MIFRPVAQNRWFIYAIVAFFVTGLYLWWQVEQDSIDADTVAATDSIIYVNRKPPVQNNLPSVADTTDWKTYRNEKYGFEFKYPHDWLFNSIDTEGIIAFQVENSLDESSKFRVVPTDNFPYGIGGDNYTEHSEKIKLVNFDAVQNTLRWDNGSFLVTIQFPNTSRELVRLELWAEDKIRLESVEKILSTLKFFEPKTQ